MNTSAPTGPTRQLERFAGGRFNFAFYFQDPGVAETELGVDIRDSLRRFFFALSGDAPRGLLEHLYTARPANARALDDMPDPAELPRWMEEEEQEIYARAFTRTGLRGTLNRYRNPDRDCRELPRPGAAGVRCPALLAAGTRNPAVVYGSLAPMLAAVPGPTRVVLLPDCGHWTQQERPAASTADLIRFLPREIEHPSSQGRHVESE